MLRDQISSHLGYLLCHVGTRNGWLFLAGLASLPYSRRSVWMRCITNVCGKLLNHWSLCINWFQTIMGVAPQWFKKRLDVALGVVASGSGIGGLVIPFIMTPINQYLGAGWTYRILGFICLVCDLVAVAFVVERIPRPKTRKRLRDIIQFDVLMNINYLLWCLASVVSLFGYFVPYFFLPCKMADDRIYESNFIRSSSVCNLCRSIQFPRISSGCCQFRL